MSGTTTPPSMNSTAKISEYGTIVVSVVAMVVYLIALAIAFFLKSDNLLTVLIGAAVANATAVVQYWVGSSRGSTMKTGLLANSTPTPPAQQPAPGPVNPAASS